MLLYVLLREREPTTHVARAHATGVLVCIYGKLGSSVGDVVFLLSLGCCVRAVQKVKVNLFPKLKIRA